MMLKGGSRTIERVVKADLCSGCGLCASVSGSGMEQAPTGYNRPRPAPPVGGEAERLLAGSCPGSRVAPWQEGSGVDPYWGPYHQILTGHAADEAVRHQASSGAGITALLVHAMRAGWIDRVIQIGADPERPTRNSISVSATVEEIVACAGSRYAASSPLETIGELLKLDGRSAFVGKPCDISALRQYARFEPLVDRRIPLMLSFFCAGIPSEAGVGRILEEMGVAEAELASFRYRGFGWPGLATAVTHDGRQETMTYARSWGTHLSREVQFRCKICPDAVGGVADVACADAWYGDESGYPAFEEQGGRSLIITRTGAGEKLLRSAVEAGDLAVEPLEIAAIERMQPGQARRKRAIRARLLALDLMLRRRPRMDGVKVNEAAARAGPRETLKNMVGMMRRLVVRKRPV